MRTWLLRPAAARPHHWFSLTAGAVIVAAVAPAGSLARSASLVVAAATVIGGLLAIRAR